MKEKEVCKNEALVDGSEERAREDSLPEDAGEVFVSPASVCVLVPAAADGGDGKVISVTAGSVWGDGRGG